MKPYTAILPLIICILISTTIFSIPEPFVEYTGKAFSAQGEFVFKEHQKEFFYKNKIVRKLTEYRNPENNVIARRNLDFRKSLYCPDVIMEDFRNGKRSMVTINQDKIRLYFKKDSISEEKIKDINLPGNFITDDGLHFFIMIHWNYLLENKKVYFYFPVPRLSNIYKFQLSLDNIKEKGKVIIRMDPLDFILKKLMKPVYFEYDKGMKRLVRYSGISILPDDPEKISNVVVYYNYPDLIKINYQE